MGDVRLFRSSPRYTLGVEVEFQTLDRDSLNLAPLAPLLQENAPPILKPRIAEELIQSILEIRTGVCFTLADVEYDLQQTCCLAEELAADNGCILHAASLHPFALVEDQVLTPTPRYSRLLEELQLVGRQFISQGFHVHVGMADGDRAVRVWNVIQGFLPLLLAASASSPFFEGRDTGFMSYRTKLFEMLPLAGLYSYFRDWKELTGEVERLIKLGVIESMRDLWWDARLNPGFGTVEIRICDLPGRFSDILGITACIQCLAALIDELDGELGELNPRILQVNKWQAARHGLDGKYVDPTGLLSSEPMKIADAWSILLDKLGPMSIRLGCEEHLGKMERIFAESPVAVLQRQVYARENNLREVVRTLQQEFWK